MRKVIILVVLLVVGVLMTFLIRECRRKLDNRKLREASTPLPDFQFQTLDEKKFGRENLQKGIPLVLFRMHPECEQCQAEAAEVKKHLEWFRDAQVLIVSAAPLEMLSEFANYHGLTGQDRVYILHDPEFLFEKWFGEAPYPTAIVYGKNHRITAHFPGGAKMEMIRKKLDAE